jgi:Fic family protein
MSKHHTYIWQKKGWPALEYDLAAIAPDLAQAHQALGEIAGKAGAIGLAGVRDIVVNAFSGEVIATAAIEGQLLSDDVVRSSVMRRLGLADSGAKDRNVEGLVQVIDDSLTAFNQPLDEDRLCRWQSALFPGGTSGMQRIVGRYRDHEDPMQIVSGLTGREVVHYEAPPSNQVRKEMMQFLDWFAKTGLDGPTPMVGLVRAALAHLWFETIHPFEDGNGRIGRAVVDLAIAQHQGESTRLYSLSRQLLSNRKGYYDALNAAQRGSLDVTAWVRWFAQQFQAACRFTSAVIDASLEKKRFWDQHASSVNDRQRKVLQRLLDLGDGGFLGGMTAEKYVKMTGASKATATRDLAQMVVSGQMQTQGVGKATKYFIRVPGWSHESPHAGVLKAADKPTPPTAAA